MRYFEEGNSEIKYVRQQNHGDVAYDCVGATLRNTKKLFSWIYFEKINIKSRYNFYYISIYYFSVMSNSTKIQILLDCYYMSQIWGW